MQQLNLPPVNPNLKVIEGKYHIFDIIRKKFLILTPEEWVRQNIIHYLIDYHNYSKALISVEGGLKYNQLAKRTDIVVYDHFGNPYLLIECKAYEVKLNQKTVEQAAVYNQKLNAPYLMITNGMKHYCCNLNKEGTTYELCSDIPKPPSR